MVRKEEIKAIASEIWPTAARFDVHEGRCGHVCPGGVAPKQIRLAVIGRIGKLADWEFAESPEALVEALVARLRQKR